MAFGIYVHIPYCLQICPYCDFTKYELGKSLDPSSYAVLIQKEIRERAIDVPHKKIDTIYFGGGTPSLLEPGLILSILNEIEKAGFSKSAETEITLEIDPGTGDERRISTYLEMGVNRFSVGAQTFNERLLKVAGRKHSAQDTASLLALLQRWRVNYSFDLLFSLPTQTLEELRADVSTALAFEPAHLSAYCLNVPEGHKLDVGRAPEEEQVEMFDLIEDKLSEAGLARYEISNFARPGRESQHNLLYWTDQAYWGLGLSAHSYFPTGPASAHSTELPWGVRLWNVRAMKRYLDSFALGDERESSGARQQNQTWSFLRDLPSEQIETLALHQALTDFCHTSLRLRVGLDANTLRLKFGAKISLIVESRLAQLEATTLIERTTRGWTMTRAGRLVANLVFEKLTFLPEEIALEN
jgi:oxygen-independent coproporphyrinogen-3 oxidase